MRGVTECQASRRRPIPLAIKASCRVRRRIMEVSDSALRLVITMSRDRITAAYWPRVKGGFRVDDAAIDAGLLSVDWLKGVSHERTHCLGGVSTGKDTLIAPAHSRGHVRMRNIDLRDHDGNDSQVWVSKCLTKEDRTGDVLIRRMHNGPRPSSHRVLADVLGLRSAFA
jgi:hypothetical protein